MNEGCQTSWNLNDETTEMLKIEHKQIFKKKAKNYPEANSETTKAARSFYYQPKNDDFFFWVSESRLLQSYVGNAKWGLKPKTRHWP